MNHHILFETLRFFIRFQPSVSFSPISVLCLLNNCNQTQKYILVCYDSFANPQSLQGCHGKAIALDINHQHAPLPLLFLLHEYRVCTRNFYQPTPDVEVTNKWQDWLINRAVVNEGENGSFSLNRDAPARVPGHAARRSMRLQNTSTAGPQNSISPPTDAIVNELLTFQHSMPSWKALVRGSISWEGTADENVLKYVENVGIEEPAA
jgi:hypothetical protein